MAEEVTLDFTGVHLKRKRRSKRDVEKYWNTRFNAFIRDGFNPDEAKWGADHGLPLKDSQVKQLRRHRRDLIKMYIRRFGWTRMHAMREAARDLKKKLEYIGETELNLFYEVSP